MNTVSVAINLPTGGTRQDYLHCVSTALSSAQSRGDTVAALAIAGLLQIVSEANAHAGHQTFQIR